MHAHPPYTITITGMTTNMAKLFDSVKRSSSDDEEDDELALRRSRLKISKGSTISNFLLLLILDYSGLIFGITPTLSKSRSNHLKENQEKGIILRVNLIIIHVIVSEN